MVLNLVLLFLATVLAFWLSAICGGGASLILVPVLNVLLPVSLVPSSLTVGTFTSSASRIAVFKRHIKWRVFLWFVPFSVPAVLLGAWLIKFVNPMYLQLVVGLLLIANISGLFGSNKKGESTKRHYPGFVLALVGFFAGFVSGVTGAIGLLFNRFYLRYGLTKEEIVATRAANEICLHTIKLCIYILLGLYSSSALWLGLTIALGAAVSSYTVKFILPYLSEALFKKIGYGAMVVSGISLLASTSRQIIQNDSIRLSVGKISRQNEISLQWRRSEFVLEYAYNDGLEIERPIEHKELPNDLKRKYQELSRKYDRILLEKVFQFPQKISYEFYCYKNNQCIKLEFSP